MKKAIVSLALALFTVGFVGVAFAETVATPQEAQEVVKSQLQMVLQKMNTTMHEYKDIGDLYEVVVSFKDRPQKNILYVTKNMKYVFVGAVYDTTTLKNITSEKYQEINKVDISKIPLSDAITIKKGDGSKKLIMVSDPDCPFCKEAFKWLLGQDNFTLYVFLSPIEALHPQAKDKSVQILCSKDPVKAFKDVEEGKQLKEKQCEAGLKALAKHALVSEVLQVTGTPTFVLGNGQKVDGFIKPVLEKYLKGEIK